MKRRPDMSSTTDNKEYSQSNNKIKVLHITCRDSNCPDCHPKKKEFEVKKIKSAAKKMRKYEKIIQDWVDIRKESDEEDHEMIDKEIRHLSSKIAVLWVTYQPEKARILAKEFEERKFDKTGLYETMANRNDVHYWIVEKDGSIIDPHFDNYNLIKTINGCSGSNQHEEFPANIQAKIWKHHWLTIVKPNIKMNSHNFTQEEFCKMMVDKPVYGKCFLNAFSYMKTHKGARMAIGRMGWKQTGSSAIHWEYG